MSENTHSSAHVDVQRRHSFGKLLAGGTAVAAVPAMTAIVIGQERQPGGAKGKGGQRNPAAIAARLIQTYDRDGDGALNEGELAAAMTAMMMQRAEAGKGKARGGERGEGKGKGQGQRKARKSDRPGR